jgi:hypothetical protein
MAQPDVVVDEDYELVMVQADVVAEDPKPIEKPIKMRLSDYEPQDDLLEQGFIAGSYLNQGWINCIYTGPVAPGSFIVNGVDHSRGGRNDVRSVWWVLRTCSFRTFKAYLRTQIFGLAILQRPCIVLAAIRACTT